MSTGRTSISITSNPAAANFHSVALKEPVSSSTGVGRTRSASKRRGSGASPWVSTTTSENGVIASHWIADVQLSVPTTRSAVSAASWARMSARCGQVAASSRIRGSDHYCEYEQSIKQSSCEVLTGFLRPSNWRLNTLVRCLELGDPNQALDDGTTS